MQTAVPELVDLTTESAAALESYGPAAGQPGTFATNCLLARRLVERGVRFVQLYHRGWDQHYNLPADLRLQCGDVDQPCAALIRDLKQRGLLDETLIIWGGEFGRTVYCQGKLTAENYGRDHHGRCFTMWLAGGGVRPGITHGETDEHGFNVAAGGVHVHDLNATVLALPGHRSHAPDVPLPGPRLSADRRARPGRAGNPGIIDKWHSKAWLAFRRVTEHCRKESLMQCTRIVAAGICSAVFLAAGDALQIRVGHAQDLRPAANQPVGIAANQPPASH